MPGRGVSYGIGATALEESALGQPPSFPRGHQQSADRTALVGVKPQGRWTEGRAEDGIKSPGTYTIRGRGRGLGHTAPE